MQIPAQLNSNANRYKPNQIIGNTTEARRSELIQDLADSKRNYEIDFLLSRGAKICPIEVKASGYNAHASLDAFCSKFSNRIGERYLVYTKDFRKDGETILLPVYMVSFI